jgi:hypothetical protein
MTSTTMRQHVTRLAISEIELCGWLGQAAPGDTLQYHRGFLALDRASQSGLLSARDCAELARVARRAFWAGEQGLVDLLQRRHAPNDYTYLLIARRRPKTAPVSFSALLAEQAA